MPKENWTFVQSLQINEMFVMGLNDENFEKAVAEKDYALLNQHLYRVQSLSTNDYFFRFHLETKIDNSQEAREMEKFIRTKSLKSFLQTKPHKVKISLLGKMIAK